MRTKQQRHLKPLQAGFTLIELIIVIVIIGILAAVAIPKFTNLSTDATHAKNNATLGAAKSAWTAAYAVAKGNPTAAQVVLQMDPACTGSATPYTCSGLSLAFGTDPVLAPSQITCTTSTDCPP